MHHRQRSVLSDSLRLQLTEVRPSMGLFGIKYRPCEVTLKDGSIDHHVYVQEQQKWLDVWGVDPEDDPGKRSIEIDSVAEIRESPARIPAVFADEIYAAFPLGREEAVFQLVLDDGRVITCRTGDAIDFLRWPAGVEPRQVVGVRTDVGNHRPDADIVNADFAWCLYQGVEPAA